MDHFPRVHAYNCLSSVQVILANNEYADIHLVHLSKDLLFIVGSGSVDICDNDNSCT